jgi:hypothetical protein
MAEVAHEVFHGFSLIRIRKAGTLLLNAIARIYAPSGADTYLL